MTHPPQLSGSKRELIERYLRGASPSSSFQTNGIVRRPSNEDAPLSFAQEQVVRQQRLLNDAPALFNESFTIHRDGPLNVSIVEACIVEILRRHEIWRTSYQEKNGELFQRVHPPPKAFRLPVWDIRHLAQEEREETAFRLASDDASCRFDLWEGPLVRALLLRTGENEFRLHLTAHQSVIDGISVFRIFPKELCHLYDAFDKGKPSELPELPIQFGDYAYWQRRHLPTKTLDDERNYWRAQLANAVPALNWPFRKARPAQQTFRGSLYPFTWPDGLSRSLRDLAAREGVTLFSVLLAGMSALLHTYTGQEDIVLGTLAPSGRKHTEVQDLLGYFLNPVPLRTRPSRDLTFIELLRQTLSVISNALANDSITLQEIAKITNFLPDPSRNLFFQVAISLGPGVADLPPGWRQSYMDVGSGGARWDLYLEFSDRPTGLLGRAQYNPDLFGIEDIHSLVQELQTLLSVVVSQPGLRLSQLNSKIACP